MRVPVLTYHSNNIHGNDYANNNHVALAEDLRIIHRKGRRIIPLTKVVDVLLGDAPSTDVQNAVALSFDDGSWFDWYDIDHPTCGPQRGFAGILRDFTAETGASVHATSFVIVSLHAREILDTTCLVGRGWWTDEWWTQAEHEGLIAIENHSWDHNHATLPVTAQRDGIKGTFRVIDTYADADTQIRHASDWLNTRLTPHHTTTLFAYPYGESNDYLVRDYLPNFIHEHHLHAAFGVEATPVVSNSPRWRLPRYVCGQHWKSPGELERILDS
ncbi:MAG: polysaccharide deacetylase family protein [Rhodanobacter sp.]|jgi:peptidoglycan/xylan/chitin deacetylase (PgdA/CDA1 family)|nr:polysaccharide deacetylase family protein [Rhodanobacter sp.]